jgi:hypothetical protein
VKGVSTYKRLPCDRVVQTISSLAISLFLLTISFFPVDHSPPQKTVCKQLCTEILAQKEI